MGSSDFSCSAYSGLQTGIGVVDRLLGVQCEPAATATPVLEAMEEQLQAAGARLQGMASELPAMMGLNLSRSAQEVALLVDRGRSQLAGLGQKIKELRGELVQTHKGDPELHGSDASIRITQADVAAVNGILDRADGYSQQADGHLQDAEQTGSELSLVKAGGYTHLAGHALQEAGTRIELSDVEPVPDSEGSAPPATNEGSSERAVVTPPDANAPLTTRWPSPAVAVLAGVGIGVVAIALAPVEIPTVGLAALGTGVTALAVGLKDPGLANDAL